MSNITAALVQYSNQFPILKCIAASISCTADFPKYERGKEKLMEREERFKGGEKWST